MHAQMHRRVGEAAERGIVASAWDGVCAYQPMYLFRMKMAAMGRVDDSVDWNSTLSPFATGS